MNKRCEKPKNTEEISWDDDDEEEENQQKQKKDTLSGEEINKMLINLNLLRDWRS